MEIVSWTSLPTGSQADWVSAVGTLLAFLVALLIFARSERDRTRDQARRVSGWVPGGVTRIATGQPIMHGATAVEAPMELFECLVKIRNSADELISDVHAAVVDEGDNELGADPLTWTDIGPGQELDVHLRWPDSGQAVQHVRLRLRFTDATGRRWYRVGGRLSMIRIRN